MHAHVVLAINDLQTGAQCEVDGHCFLIILPFSKNAIANDCTTNVTSPSSGGGLLGLPIPSKLDAFLNKLLNDMLPKSKSKFIDDNGDDVVMVSAEGVLVCRCETGEQLFPCKRRQANISVLNTWIVLCLRTSADPAYDGGLIFRGDRSGVKPWHLEMKLS